MKFKSIKFKSIKFKISFFYTMVLCLLLAAYSFFLYHTLSKALIEEMDKELQEKTRLINIFVKEFYQQQNKNEKSLTTAINMTVNMSQLKNRMQTYLAVDKEWLKLFDYLDLSEDFILFLDKEMTVAIKTDNVDVEILQGLMRAIQKEDIKSTYFKNIFLRSHALRSVQMPFYFNDELEFILVVATSERPMINLLNQRRNILFWSFPVILSFTILIGVIFTNFLLAPIIDVANVAERISHKDLSRRVSSEYSDEEISTLVNAFNNMINRLQKSFSHITHFNSHVAHELKTPIAIIKGECEVALRHEQQPHEYREALRTILEESQRMLKITEDLLLLARLNYSSKIFSNEEFDLKDFFYSLCLKQRQLASLKGLSFNFSLTQDDVKLKGDPVHIQRLFINLIDNAIKFTPNGGSIDFDTTVKDKNLIVRIADTGIGISQEDIPKIFDQFYHKRPIEMTDIHGTGLGLNIARTIAQIHGGIINVESSISKGSVFTVILPIIVTS